MLVDPRLAVNTEIDAILSLIGQGGRPKKVETGIYLSNSFSFDSNIVGIVNQYFEFGQDDDGNYLGAYGVCDSIEQVKQKYAKWLNDENLKFCASFTRIDKSDQPPDGGWRWHKWGTYIGDQNPQEEYLYDEDGIETVFCYHIYEIK